jgi:hypothetical protein
MSQEEYNGGWYMPWMPDTHPKCECGVSVTLGKEDQPMFHSPYCPVKARWQEDEDFKQRYTLPKGKGE